MSANMDNVRVVPELPAGHHSPSGGRDAFERLVGATIVAFGAPAEGVFEGGGLVIDYRLPGSEATERLVLDFSELGMWIEYDSARAAK